jgi:hypothetical protein
METMSTETGPLPAARRCERGGVALTAYAPEGLCPACMLRGGLDVGARGGADALSRNTSTLAVPVSEQPGERIGHYKLLQKIGEGGCGIVYMAEQQEPVRRKVALKVIKLGMDTKGRRKNRFTFCGDGSCNSNRATWRAFGGQFGSVVRP